MTRYRWFRFASPIGLPILFERLMSQALSNERESGFLPLPAKYSEMCGRFLWRTQIMTNGIDDNGEPKSEIFSSVSFMDFALKEVGENCYLRVRNPGRSTVGFFNAIEEIAGLGFWTEPVNLLPMAKDLLQGTTREIKLIGLKLTNVAVADNILARMEFVSKANIDQLTIKNLLEYPSVIDFAAYEMIIDAVKGQVSFHRNGLLKVGEHIEPFVVNLVETNLL